MPRDLLRIIACGAVDNGKSTLLGSLMLAIDGVPEDERARWLADSRRAGYPEGDPSLLFDGLDDERAQRITIDVAHRFATTAARAFHIADAPGHPGFSAAMASAAADADIALLLVDATTGCTRETRRHAAILAALGVPALVLAVNKLDCVAEPATRFAAVAADGATIAHALGLPEPLALPVIARSGNGISSHDDALAWFHGPSLIEILNQQPIRASRSSARRHAVRWQVTDDAGAVWYAVDPIAGTLDVGDAVQIARTGVVATIAEVHGATAPMLRLDQPVDLRRGDLLTSPDAPASVGTLLTADVLWFADAPLRVGQTVVVGLHGGETNAVVGRVFDRLDLDRLTRTPADRLASCDFGQVVLDLAHPLAVDGFREQPGTGACLLIDPASNATLGLALTTAIASPSVLTPVSTATRAAAKGQRGLVVWLTGLSGAGKSTLAELVERALLARGRHTMVLDGDALRRGLSAGLGFSPEDRAENIRRAAEVAALMADAGLIVLAAFVSPFASDRAAAQAIVGDDRWREVFVDAPLALCRARDVKGLYARADAGTVALLTGVGQAYEAPTNPALRVDTAGLTQDEAAAAILAVIDAAL